MSEGSSIQDSLLEAVDDNIAAYEVVNALLGAELFEQAAIVGRAELMLHPGDANVAWATAQGTLEDAEDKRALFRDCIVRAPEGSVDLHRFYQELWPESEQDQLKAEYQELLEENQGSAMFQYLMGRLLESDEALGYYLKSVEIDPAFEAVHRALGYRSVGLGHYADAAKHYDTFASFGSVQLLEVLDARIRLHRSQRVAPSAIEDLLAAAAEASEQNFYVELLRQHLRLEMDVQSLDQRLEELDEIGKAWFDLEPGHADNAWARASLAITAGDLERARAELALAAQNNGRDHAVELRLALSYGATLEDRQALLEPDVEWLDIAAEGTHLLALELFDGDERLVRLDAFEDDDLAEFGRLLEDARSLANVEAIQAVASRLSLPNRCNAYLAAYHRLKDRSDTASVRARATYRAWAQDHSSPGELPFLAL